MNKCFLVLVALVFASSAAYATGNPSEPLGGQQQSGGPGGRAGQQNPEMFSKMKQIRVEGLQGKISILQTALGCVNAATNHEQMRACEQQEHKAIKSNMQQQKAKREVLMPKGQGGTGGRRGPGDQAEPNRPGGQ